MGNAFLTRWVISGQVVTIVPFILGGGFSENGISCAISKIV
jgi:hypothetical protein